ncbi:MAG: hypothetical protein ABIK82_17110 [Pseudomonadota bacterium]
MPTEDMIGGAACSALDDATAEGRLQETDENQPLWDPNWVEPLARWEKSMANGHLIIVFCESPSVLGHENGAQIVFDFANEVAPSPGIYLVGQTVSSHAWYLPNTGTDFQQDCKRIVKLNLEKPSAMILGRKAAHVLLWVDGIDHPRLQIPIPLPSKGLLKESEILDLLDRFEAYCWTDDFRKNIWEKADQWIPKEQAEKIVQSDLHHWLRAWFRDFTTLAETNAAIGRADFFMISTVLSSPERAVLELKVVRGLTSTGSSVNASQEQKRILGGRIQAQSYAKDFGAAIRLLCAYDLRKKKQTDFFAPIEDECKKDKVTFKSYKIFNSAPTAQAASVGAAQPN